MPKTVTQRHRRTDDEIIADLQRKIEQVKRNAECKKAKKDPSLRHVSAALRSIDKAVAHTGDAATRNALGEARATLAACLALNGAAAPKAGRGVLTPRRSANGRIDPERVLQYLQGHPGSLAEDIAAALGTDADHLRPAIHQLRADATVRVEGKARATRYFMETGAIG
jgi:hypothetical protein